jgi:hypothetical protein
MKANLVFFTLFSLTCSLAGMASELEESLVNQGFTKSSIKHCDTFEGIPFAVIRSPKGSAFRRSFVKVLQKGDVRWEVVASVSFSTPDISASVDRGKLVLVGRFSHAALMTAELSHLLRSNKVLLNEMEAGR